MESSTCLKRSTLEDSMFGVSTLMTLSLESPNSYIAGHDGKWDTHTLLLAIHSSLIKHILETLTDHSDAVVILPDFSFSEVSVLMEVLLGIKKIAFVGGDLLETLCMGHYKNIVFDIIENAPQPSNEVIVISNDNLNESDSKFEDANENDAHNLNTVEPEGHFHEKQANIGSVSEVSKQNAFKCNSCDKLFKTEKTLKNHRKLKHEADPTFLLKAKGIAAEKSLCLKCSICGLLLNTRKLKTHFKEKHPEISQDVECELCDKWFPDTSHLNRHTLVVHSEVKRFECDICDYKTKLSETLREHKKIHNNNFFDCPNCDFRSRRERELKAHKCVKKLFSCGQCGVKAVSQNALRQHRRRKHS